MRDRLTPIGVNKVSPRETMRRGNKEPETGLWKCQVKRIYKAQKMGLRMKHKEIGKNRQVFGVMEAKGKENWVVGGLRYFSFFFNFLIILFNFY